MAYVLCECGWNDWKLTDDGRLVCADCLKTCPDPFGTRVIPQSTEDPSER